MAMDPNRSLYAQAKEIIPKLTTMHQEVLGAVMINQDLGHPRGIIRDLVKKGLIEPFETQMHFADGFPPMQVTRYTYEIPAHLAWCEWCSENFSEEDEEA